MKKTLTLTALVFALSLGIVQAAEGNSDSLWKTNFEEAKESAATQGLPILANFTGSDWCGWCIKLHKNVFSKKAFKEYAKENLVLLKVDFPRRKEQSADVKQQNKKLAEKYGIKGFPTILVLNSDGEVLLRTGFKKGGAEKYVEHLKGRIQEAKQEK